MKQRFIISIIALLTAIAGHAVDDVVVDGVTYEWYENPVSHEYGYIATGWDGEVTIQSLRIRGEVDGYEVFRISEGAFQDITQIVYLTIDEGVYDIEDYAFSRCTNLKSVILPEGLRTIGQFAFEFDSLLTVMVIPSTVINIGAHAFSGCTGVTDVYFLLDDASVIMDDSEYGFDWWDGVYALPGEDPHGGMEFNTNQNTIVHVPEGTYEDYDASGKLEAWLFREDSGAYPLWWIVNYGVVGREYTVSDDLAAIYTDVDDGLYAKDDNMWLTPDQAYPGEIDYMRATGLMNTYDQSNWVVLRNIANPNNFIGHVIEGATITGTLINKKNPEIEVSSTPTMGDGLTYTPNVYIPCAFMGRTQTVNEKTYAFVQPKPQEYIKIDRAIYNETLDENEFYIPAPDEDEEINLEGLYGGFMISYDLYEESVLPNLEDWGYYTFYAINRKTVVDDMQPAPSFHKVQSTFEPYVDGGLSEEFTVFALYLPDEPTPTGVTNIVNHKTESDTGWYSIDGRYLGTKKPVAPGIYINSGKKLVIK